MERLGSIIGPILSLKQTVEPLSGVRLAGAALFMCIVMGVLIVTMLA